MDNRVELVETSEEQRMSRTMMAWINTYPDLPVSIVNFEQLKADSTNVAFYHIQGARVVTRYILGGYRGEYQFQVIYRIKPGVSNDARLKADEFLNAIGDWALKNWPDLGESIRVRRLEATTRSSLLQLYPNGEEDRQILMRMIYEVI